MQQVIITGMTKGQKEWLKNKALAEGISMTALVKNWINSQIKKEAVEVGNEH